MLPRAGYAENATPNDDDELLSEMVSQLEHAAEKKTVFTYHSALMSHRDVVIRTWKEKPLHREVAETSQRIMLSNLCGYLLALSLVESNIPDRFKLKTANLGDGVKLSRKLLASALGVDENMVHFVLPSLVINTDDMAAFYSQDGGTVLDQEPGLVLKGNVAGKNKRSYSVHHPANEGANKKFKGRKARFTTSMTASGSLGKTCVQILGLTDAEMPPEIVPSGVVLMEVECLSPVRL